MDEIINNYLEAEYGGPVPERWQLEKGEYHSSNTHGCMREWYWQHKKGNNSDPSPYFELGHAFEEIYGNMLAEEYGEDRVIQDVNIEVRFDGYHLTGEADWVVLNEGADPIDEVIVHEDGSRTCVEWEGIQVAEELLDGPHDLTVHRAQRILKEVCGEEPDAVQGEEVEYDGRVAHAVETKTTKNAHSKLTYSYNQGHLYQLMSYMHTLQPDQGWIVYMERNDLSDAVFEIEYDPDLWEDIANRLKMIDYYLEADKLPDADPDGDPDWACKYCNFKEECEEKGGTRWE